MQRTIRTARAADAPAIARAHVDSWHAAYRDLLPEQAILSRTVETRTAQWGEWLADPQHRRILVAELGGRVVGFASAGPGRDADLGPLVAELYAIYVAPDGLGQGLGSMLWAALPDQLALDGFRDACLWVAAANSRARSFYDRCGFVTDGATKQDCFADAPLEALRYRAGLPDQPFVVGLATALDDEDFPGTARRLDPEVSYETGQELLRGPDAVVASYRRAAEGAHRMLDELVNESIVKHLGGQRYRIDYTDRLRHRGHIHVFRCQQIVTLPEGRGVTRIQHRELSGERQRLLAFFRRAGVRAG